jgi:transcriptional regulator GlxA family with amidase domain
MQVAIVVYPGFTALDALGPYEVLKLLPGAELRFVAHEVGPVPTDRGILVIGATHRFDETERPDLVLVPGSEAETATAAADGRLIDWLARVHPTTTFTTSVCSGAIVLGAAGLLEGRPATTHWAAMDALKRFGAIPRPSERIVRAEKVWTAAGVSAGLDLALALVVESAGRETAERIQLLIEYDPQPPVSSGHMAKASVAVAEAARKEMAALARNPRDVVSLPKLAWRTALRKAARAASRRAGKS